MNFLIQKKIPCKALSKVNVFAKNIWMDLKRKSSCIYKEKKMKAIFSNANGRLLQRLLNWMDFFFNQKYSQQMNGYKKKIKK